MGRKMLCLVMPTLFLCSGVANAKYDVQMIYNDSISLPTIIGITNSGVICGKGNTSIGCKWGVFRYYVDTNKTEFTDQMLDASDMNNTGTVAGFYSKRNGDKQFCIWSANGTITDLPMVTNLGSGCYDYARINDAGKVIGHSNSFPGFDFVWDATSGKSSPVKPDNWKWSAIDINNFGSYLEKNETWSPTGLFGGSSSINNLSTNAIISENGVYHEIDNNSKTKWMFLNDRNQVAGIEKADGYTHVVQWDSIRGKVDITAGENCNYSCLAQNNLGQILLKGGITVVDSTPGLQLLYPNYYVWDAIGGLQSISDLIGIGNGFQISSCQAINDKGWIAGYGWNNATHNEQLFLLRPLTTPEPGSVISILVGLIGLGGLAAKRRARQ